LFSIFLLFPNFIFSLNFRPIIGILTQPTDGVLTSYGTSYIAASYVKYAESGGARVVPIFHNSTFEELDSVFNNINGILFPGGGSDLNGTQLFYAGQRLYRNAIQANWNGDYFPIFGHCQGFELLALITSQDFNILSSVDAENISMPLYLTDEAMESRWLGSAPSEVIEILTTEAVTMNNHVECVTPYDFENNEYLPRFYSVLSTNKDKEGKEFISLWEGNNFPIYGMQWHAEKPQFEWNPNEGINHSYDAIIAMQYFAQFMVQEARMNNHSYQSEDEEFNSLIYNYSPFYTENLVPDFEQVYFF